VGAARRRAVLSSFAHLRNTNAAWREAAFDLVDVVAGDGFEPTTFGL
jgi:hypothetical protein